MGTPAGKSSSILLILLLILSHFSVQVVSVVKECGADEDDGCTNKKRAQSLKIIAIVSILVTSMIGVCLPLVTRSVPALSPERSLFVIVKAFAAGIILATGFMHVLPDSFDMLSSACLDEHPWHKFPFTGFVAMLSAIITLMIDSIATSLYSQKHKGGVVLPDSAAAGATEREMEAVVVVDAAAPAPAPAHPHSHSSHGHYHGAKLEVGGAQLLRYRVIAMVLELGIIVHSVVIGLSLGASNNTCSIKGLVAALCFHQMFEGMGLGGCILQAEYGLAKKAAMAFFFAVTTPFGIALGMALSSTYKENSPRALITVGLLNASSAGLLIYMALVDLLASDFMGTKLQASVRLQLKSYAAVLLGAGGMSLMAKWA
ncbi:probable zinc transporter 10 [Andrographis paniculata]|uniref:probable zinc transporter 10 n=1 Tax=Andrographis paniculata TaxID=175694 RepID=UPI0021E8956A|nr:probable zinc transporter 10 [Andrographis paniculata]